MQRVPITPSAAPQVEIAVSEAGLCRCSSGLVSRRQITEMTRDVHPEHVCGCLLSHSCLVLAGQTGGLRPKRGYVRGRGHSLGADPYPAADQGGGPRFLRVTSW